MRTQAQDIDTRHSVAVLSELIQLEYDAMATYRAAVDRVYSLDARCELAVFFSDHEGNARAFASCVERYGGEPSSCGDLGEAWTKGRRLLADVVGDAGVLSALGHLEDDVHRAYERAQNDLRTLADPPLAAAFDSALAEDEHHREWLMHGSRRPSRPEHED